MDNDNKVRCPECGSYLEQQNEGLWCERNRKFFEVEEVERNNEWRSLSVEAKVERFKALGEDEAKKKYYLRDEQVKEVLTLVTEGASVSKTTPERVEPEKGSLIGLARAVTDEAALCELVDNAIDAGKRRRPNEPVTVSITFDKLLRKIVVRDDAGGMDREDMRRCFTLGAHKLDRTAGLIGRYGIGAKESIYHFGRAVIVRSHLLGETSGIRTVVPEKWLAIRDWTIYIEDGLKEIPEGTTSIEIDNLETVEFRNVEELRRHIGHTYERLISDRMLTVILDGEPVAKDVEYTALYPPYLYPRVYRMRSARVEIIVKVMLISRPADAAGMSFYAQGRRYAHLPWSSRRVKMVLDTVQKHKLRDHIRVEVDFEGPIEDIPINATKDDLTENTLLSTIAPLISKMVVPYFKAIPPLSQLGGMAVVNKITEDHALAFRQGVEEDLGRIGDRTSIPSVKLGDAEKFKQFLLPYLKSTSDSENTEPVTRAADGSQPKTDEGPNDEAGPALGENEAVSKASGLNHLAVRVSMLCDSVDKKRAFVNWLNTGRALGVEIFQE